MTGAPWDDGPGPVHPAEDPLLPGDEAFAAVLGPALGRPLRRVAASVYALDGRIADGACDVWLYFEGLAPIHLRGAGDGWRLQIGREPPEPLDMEEMGELVVRDLSRTSVFRASVGQPLQAAWIVVSTLDRGAVGVRLDFGGLVRPMVLNLDDELWVSHRYPRDLFVEEDYVEIPLAPAGA